MSTGVAAEGRSALTRPDISVVIASVNGLPYPLACLESLSRQRGDLTVEVILADCTGPSTVAAVRERFPDVEVLAFAERKSVPWLRAAGIRVARGHLVAVTEDHCVPRADWCQCLKAVHERTGWAVVGGGVEHAATGRTVDWAVFFCEYSQLMHPAPEGPNQLVAGMNVAYDMDALEAVRGVFDEGLWENVLHERLRSYGHVTGLDPSIVVEHRKYFTVPMFLAERFHYSRAFAGARVQGRPLSARLPWAAATVALAPLLVARVTRQVWRRRQHLWRYARAFPIVVLFTLMWAAGECVGYLAGPGDSLVKIR